MQRPGYPVKAFLDIQGVHDDRGLDLRSVSFFPVTLQPFAAACASAGISPFTQAFAQAFQGFVIRYFFALSQAPPRFGPTAFGSGSIHLWHRLILFYKYNEHLFIMINFFLSLQRFNAMSPRPKQVRTVFDPPKFKGYKPFGYYSGQGEPVRLLMEEYTAIRLCDYELMTQSEAAAAMKVSRPTFTRLYEEARRKIAKALSEALVIEVNGGNAYFDYDWYHCWKCNVFFNNPGGEFPEGTCPLCRQQGLEQVNGK